MVNVGLEERERYRYGRKTRSLDGQCGDCSAEEVVITADGFAAAKLTWGRYGRRCEYSRYRSNDVGSPSADLTSGGR